MPDTRVQKLTADHFNLSHPMHLIPDNGSQARDRYWPIGLEHPASMSPHITYTDCSDDS